MPITVMAPNNAEFQRGKAVSSHSLASEGHVELITRLNFRKIYYSGCAIDRMLK